MDHIWSFLTYNQEQKDAMVSDPRVAGLIDSKKNITSNHFKYDLYTQFYQMKPRKKKTGFEEFAELDAAVRSELTDMVDTPSFGSVIESPNKVDSFLEVAARNAKEVAEIAKSQGKEVVLLFSGGIDSELMLRIFLDAGVNFRTVFFDYKGKNSYDREYAVDTCNRLGIKLEIFNLDVEKYFSTEDIKFRSKLTGITSPQLLTYHYMANYVVEELNGFPVLAGEYRFVKNDTNIYAELSWKVCGTCVPACSGTGGAGGPLVCAVIIGGSCSNQDPSGPGTVPSCVDITNTEEP